MIRPMPMVRNAQEFYANALAIERYLHSTYLDLQRQMQEQGDRELEGYLKTLAEEQELQIAILERSTRGLILPYIEPGKCPWGEYCETDCAEFRLGLTVTPEEVLRGALDAAKCVVIYYRQIGDSTRSREVQMLAWEFALEEQQQVRQLDAMISRRYGAAPTHIAIDRA